MTPEEIEKLRDHCKKFAKFREVNADGKGNNLHDIKISFDYVSKTIEENNLSGTTFGDELAAKARAASSVLSELWNVFNQLEKSVTNFCDQAESNNKTN